MQLKKLTHDKEHRALKYSGEEYLNIFTLNNEIWEKAENYQSALKSLRDQFGVDEFLQEINDKNAERDRLLKLKSEKEAEVANLNAQADALIKARQDEAGEGATVATPREARRLQKKAEDIEIPAVPDQDTRTLENLPSVDSYKSEVQKLLKLKVSLTADPVFLTEDTFDRVNNESAVEVWLRFPWFFYLTKKKNMSKAKETVNEV